MMATCYACNCRNIGKLLQEKKAYKQARVFSRPAGKSSQKRSRNGRGTTGTRRDANRHIALVEVLAS